MGKSLHLNTFTKGADIRFSVNFTAIAESSPVYQVDLKDANVYLNLFYSKEDMEAGFPVLLTISTQSGLNRNVDTSDVCEVYGRIPGAVTETWNPGSIHYRFKVVTVAGEILSGDSYDGTFRLKS